MIYMVAERIKQLREQSSMTQADLARRLGVTRSSVNAWEMGISAPSTQYIVELAKMFKVSSDYLLGLDTSATVNVAGLSQKDVQFVNTVVAYLRGRAGEE